MQQMFTDEFNRQSLDSKLIYKLLSDYPYKITCLATNFGRFILISDKFRTAISDILVKHSLSKFTPTKHELDWNKICENELLLQLQDFTNTPTRK